MALPWEYVTSSVQLLRPTIIYIGCTHGHGSEGFQLQMPVEGMSWVPRPEQQLLGVRGTSSASWRRIVRDSAMITKNREALLFSTFRQKMIVKEMRQLKSDGIYIFVDPADLSQRLGFDVTVNLNDVITIAIGGEGFHIRHILAAINYDDTPADILDYEAPPIPEKWEALIREFAQQLADPASALYDDSHGTTGPVAQERVQRAQNLAHEYARFATTLAIPNTQNANPQIEENDTIDTDATSDPMLQALDQNREDPVHKHTVIRMVRLVHLWSEDHIRRQHLASVKSAREAPVDTSLDEEKYPPVDPFDNADFGSDSDAHSYEGTPSSTSPKELHAFNKEELLQFENIYKIIAVSFVDIYTSHCAGLLPLSEFTLEESSLNRSHQISIRYHGSTIKVYQLHSSRPCLNSGQNLSGTRSFSHGSR